MKRYDKLTVGELRDKLNELCDDGLHDIPIATYANNHYAKDDSMTITKCNASRSNGKRYPYILIGNYWGGDINGSNFEFIFDC